MDDLAQDHGPRDRSWLYALIYITAAALCVVVAHHREPSPARRGCFLMELQDGTGVEVCPTGKVTHA